MIKFKQLWFLKRRTCILIGENNEDPRETFQNILMQK